MICGWSGVWDHALRDVLSSCSNFRYSTYWTYVDAPPQGIVNDLVVLRKANLTKIDSADSFFGEIHEKVMSLQEMSSVHPLTVESAIATTKKYLSEPKYRIKLHDLIFNETEQVVNSLGNNTEVTAFYPDEPKIVKAIALYEEQINTLLGMVITGFYWGNEENLPIWIKSLEKLYDITKCGKNTYTATVNLLRYPCLLFIYAAGIAALLSNKDTQIIKLILDTKVWKNREKEPICKSVYTWSVIEDNVAKSIFKNNGNNNYKYPTSEHLFSFFRSTFSVWISNEETYTECFDKVEYLVGLTVSLFQENSKYGVWGPVGCFAYRRKNSRNALDIGEEMLKVLHEILPCRDTYQEFLERKNSYDQFCAVVDLQKG